MNREKETPEEWAARLTDDELLAEMRRRLGAAPGHLSAMVAIEVESRFMGLCRRVEQLAERVR